MDYFQKFPIFTKYYTSTGKWKSKYRFCFLAFSFATDFSAESKQGKPIKIYRFLLIFSLE